MSDVIKGLMEELNDSVETLPGEELPEGEDSPEEIPTEEPEEESEQVLMLRLMLDDNETPASLLDVYLKIAAKKILARAYPYDKTVTEVPEEYKLLQLEIAAYLINKRGAEGQISHMENGITRMYENADIPASMLKQVTPYCGVPGFIKPEPNTEVKDEIADTEQD